MGETRLTLIPRVVTYEDMERKLQVMLRTFEGEYHYPNGLLADAADYIDALEREIERLQQPAPVVRDVNGVAMDKGE